MSDPLPADARLRLALDDARAAVTPALALRILDDAVVEAPALAQAATLHHARASLLMALGRVDDAVAAATRTVELAPGVPDLATNLGATLLQRFRLHGDVADLAGARAVLDEAVGLGPRTPAVRATLALVLQLQGQAAAAVAVCDDNLRAFPADAPTAFNRAAALQALGRTSDARAALQALAPTFPPARTALDRLPIG